MVEVFKTNIQEESQSDKMVQLLLHHFPDNRISFDLEDCDKILRVEGDEVCPVTIIKMLRGRGFDCLVLD